MKPKVSVIIVNYKSEFFLEICLGHLRSSVFDGEMESILVNNSPEDGSAFLLAEKFPWVKVLTPDRNLGFGPANNLAFEHASGEFFLLLNPDAFISRDGLQKGLDYFRDHPRVGVVGGQFLTEEGQWQPSARMFPTVFDKVFRITGLSDRFPKSRIFGRENLTWWDHSCARAVDWVVGAFFMIRADLVRELGGFDERFFLYYEELELCRRVKKMGFQVHYLPEVRIRHVGGGSSLGASMERFSLEGSQITLFRMFSEALYYGKYFGKLGAWLMLGVERGWLWIRMIKNRLKGSEPAKKKVRLLARQINTIKVALSATHHGRISPEQPWNVDEKYYDSCKEN